MRAGSPGATVTYKYNHHPLFKNHNLKVQSNLKKVHILIMTHNSILFDIDHIDLA